MKDHPEASPLDAPPGASGGATPSRLRVACLGALLVGLTAAAYLPVWENDFVNFDDDPYITRTPEVKEGLNVRGFRWAWTNEVSPYWMPLTWLSFQFDAQFFSGRTPEGEVVLSPTAFHGDNLFWHLASTLLLFALGLRLTGALWRSFLFAALFALHPMHVESVGWAIERKDVLSVFFGVLTLWLYVRWAENPSRLRYLAVAAAFLLSLLAKPMLMTLPVVLLLLDYWPLRRWGADAAGTPGGPDLPRVSLGRVVREKGPLFVLAGALALVTVRARESHGAGVSLDEIPLSDRLGNALVAYDNYLVTTFCPLHLAHLYPHPRRHWSRPGALAGAAVLAGLSALFWWQRQRRPWLIVGWLWFVGTLLPVIGLAQGGAQGWADRFSYWPHVGLFLAVAWQLAELVERWRIPALVAGAAATLVLACLAALTWVQLGYWRDSVTSWEHTLAVTRDNAFAHERLSVALRQVGRIEEANFHLQEAVRIHYQRLGSGK